MGILNVTPDSFSDGGEHLSREAAIAHGLRLLAEGADLIDVGGESTRPGAGRAPEATELARVIPVVSALAGSGGVICVDTMRAVVAERAVAAGASVINDVSGGLADPDMLQAVAGLGVGYVAMHWRGHSDVMTSLTHYDDVVGGVVAELGERREAAFAAGIAPANLVLDPGLGFAKTAAQNWELLGHLDRLSALGQPLLIGASRKRFLGELLAVGDELRPPEQRDDATAALTALLAAQGVWGVRTHTVTAQRDAIEVAQRLAGARATTPA